MPSVIDVEMKGGLYLFKLSNEQSMKGFMN